MPEHAIQPALLAFALSYPEAFQDHPWGEVVVKVNKKIFVMFGSEAYNAGRLRMTVKLPDSHQEALSLEFTERPGYNLGNHGWVTAVIAPQTAAPQELLREWIDESYRTIAPKRLIKGLDPNKPALD